MMIEYSYHVEQCQTGQWRYAVIEHSGDGDFEVEGGAGFEDETEAHCAGAEALSIWRGRLETLDY